MVEPVERSATSLYMNPQPSGVERSATSLYKNLQPAGAEDARAAEKAVNIYKGHFLPDDVGREWAASTRLCLQNKFRNVAASLGIHLEQAGQWGKAAAHYQKAIEVDGLAEAFYRRLMVCHQNLGQRAQGIEVYRHLKTTLFSALGITPSPETEHIHQSLLGKSKAPGIF